MSQVYNGDGTKQDPPVEDLPQTETVFNQPALLPSEHTFVQQGYMAIDMCDGCPHMGIPIPSGKTLIRDELGEYQLVDENPVPSPVSKEKPKKKK